MSVFLLVGTLVQGHPSLPWDPVHKHSWFTNVLLIDTDRYTSQMDERFNTIAFFARKIWNAVQKWRGTRLVCLLKLLTCNRYCEHLATLAVVYFYHSLAKLALVVSVNQPHDEQDRQYNDDSTTLISRLLSKVKQSSDQISTMISVLVGISVVDLLLSSTTSWSF